MAGIWLHVEVGTLLEVTMARIPRQKELGSQLEV